MKSRVIILLALPAAVTCFASGAAAQALYTGKVEDLTTRAVESPVVPSYTRSEQGSRMLRTAGAAASLALMTSHGGSTMSKLSTKAIYWGNSWSATSEKVIGLDSFFTGWNNSNAAKTNIEYAGVTVNIPYAGRYMDSSAVTANAGAYGNSAAIVAEICKVTNNRPDSYTHYAVFAETKRGTNPYCAFHGVSYCPSSRIPFTYSWYFNLDGDTACDPRDTVTGHSQGLAALANVVAHELSETMTDPGVLVVGSLWYLGRGGWYDAMGYENGDKCAWTFGAPYVTLSNGTRWKLQGEWSNKAFLAGTGYPNSNGQKGCLTGGP